MAGSSQPRTVLEQLIREDGRSYDRLAAEFDDLARRRGIDATISSKHLQRLARRERSHESCRPGTRKAFEEMWGRRFGELFTEPVVTGDGNGDTAAVSTTLSYPRTVGDSITALTQLTHDELNPTDTAAKILVVPEAWASLLVKAAYGKDEEAPAPADPVALSVEHVQQVHDATEMFSTFDHRYGGGQSKPLVAQYLQTAVLPLLPQVSPAHAVGREYFKAVASLTLRAGWTAYDIGEHGYAQQYLYQAYRLSRAAGDRAFSGHVLACMSHQANFLGFYEDATYLARAAVHHGTTGGATPTTMALFHAMEARALASQGNEPEATAALIAAERWLGQSRPANDPAWVWFFDAAELHAEFAHCFRDLGNAELAHTHAAASITESKDVFVRSLSFCRSVLATSHLLANDLDQALEVATGVIDTAAHLNSYRVVSYLNEFRQRLTTGFNSPAIDVFDDYFRTKLGSESSPVPGRIIVP